MKALSAFLACLLCLYSVNCGYELTKDDSDFPTPLLSLNGDYNSTFLQSLDTSVFISQALSYIFTGTFDGSSDFGSQYDNNSIANLIDLGLLYFASSVSDDPPENFEEIYRKLKNIADRLRFNGTTAVFFSDIKDYLNAQVALGAFGLYYYENKDQIYARLQNYIRYEFLGGFEDGICKNHTLQWFMEVQNFEYWALQMLDATAKIPSGILGANINWLGNYKECNDVYNQNGYIQPIQGRYCRVAIGFPVQQFAGDLPIDDNLALNVGTCFSSVCSNDEVSSIMSNSLKLIGAFKYSWVKETKCDDSKTIKPTGAAVFYMVALSLIIGWCVLATLFDIHKRIQKLINTKEIDPTLQLSLKTEISGSNVVDSNQKVSENPQKLSTFEQFLINCSLYANAEKFFRTDNGGKITCLNGIRALSMVWIIWGHTYNYATDRTYFFLIDNIRDIAELNEKSYAQLILNAMYGVDTFFLMSAFLLTISFFNKLQKSKSLSAPEWAYYYIHRYWRLLPPYLIIIVIFVCIMPYIGNGPLWTAKDFPIRNEHCHTYWWAYLLFLNNFVPNGKGASCMGYLWYIPNDYQFYAISPIFLVLLFRYPKAGKILLSTVLLSSLLILGFLTANIYVTRQRDIIQVLLDMWENIYIKPYCRAAPWIVGIMLGYLFYNLKNVKLSWYLVALGWLLSAIFALSAIFGGYTNHAKDGRRMIPFEYALYFTMTRLTWSLSIGWIIFACHYGYGGIINDVLSAKIFVPLTRLSYCAYLIHPPLMVSYYFSQRTLFHADTISLIYLALGHIIVTFILSFFYTLLFEVPFVAVEKIVYPKGH